MRKILWSIIFGLNKNLNIKFEGVEEVLIRIFDAFALGVGHQIEVNGFTSDDGAEGTVFHDDHIVADFGDQKGGLSGSRNFGVWRNRCGLFGIKSSGPEIGHVWICLSTWLGKWVLSWLHWHRLTLHWLHWLSRHCDLWLAWRRSWYLVLWIHSCLM